VALSSSLTVEEDDSGESEAVRVFDREVEGAIGAAGAVEIVDGSSSTPEWVLSTVVRYGMSSRVKWRREINLDFASSRSCRDLDFSLRKGVARQYAAVLLTFRRTTLREKGKRTFPNDRYDNVLFCSDDDNETEEITR